MKSNPYKERGFVPGEYTEENYDKIDLHRPYVDDIILVSKDGQPMKRESDLIDVWFDSGAMPYAQIHYPFENKELLDSRQVYPADFIAEGVDQTRGWFFTYFKLSHGEELVIMYQRNGSEPYFSIVVNGSTALLRRLDILLPFLSSTSPLEITAL